MWREEDPMRTYKCAVSALILASAIAFGAVAMAAGLPKSGTYNLEFTSYGTAKVAVVGKGRVLVAWDENGLSRGAGFGDHVTWHLLWPV